MSKNAYYLSVEEEALTIEYCRNKIAFVFRQTQLATVTQNILLSFLNNNQFLVWMVKCFLFMAWCNEIMKYVTFKVTHIFSCNCKLTESWEQ